MLAVHPVETQPGCSPKPINMERLCRCRDERGSSRTEEVATDEEDGEFTVDIAPKNLLYQNNQCLLCLFIIQIHCKSQRDETKPSHVTGFHTLGNGFSRKDETFLELFQGSCEKRNLVS